MILFLKGFEVFLFFISIWFAVAYVIVCYGTLIISGKVPCKFCYVCIQCMYDIFEKWTRINFGRAAFKSQASQCIFKRQGIMSRFQMVENHTVKDFFFFLSSTSIRYNRPFHIKKIPIAVAEFQTIMTEHGALHGCLLTMIELEICVKLHKFLAIFLQSWNISWAGMKFDCN